MVLVDTSVWIDVLRDGTGAMDAMLERLVAGGEIWLTRLTALELRQGARDEREWTLLSEVAAVQLRRTARTDLAEGGAHLLRLEASRSHRVERGRLLQGMGRARRRRPARPPQLGLRDDRARQAAARGVVALGAAD